MLKNLCGNKRKNKSGKFSENLNALRVYGYILYRSTYRIQP
jgi:hypothetical protein